MTKVINIRAYSETPYEYCGRGSIFGNPFEIGRDGTREEVINKFAKWFNFCLKDKRFYDLVLTLKDEKLGCYCKRADKEVSCHCDVIAKWLDEQPKQE